MRRNWKVLNPFALSLKKKKCKNKEVKWNIYTTQNIATAGLYHYVLKANSNT